MHTERRLRVHTELGSWQRAWQGGSGHGSGGRGGGGETGGGGGGGGRGEGGGGGGSGGQLARRRRTALIKSNNPWQVGNNIYINSKNKNIKIYNIYNKNTMYNIYI